MLKSKLKTNEINSSPNEKIKNSLELQSSEVEIDDSQIDFSEIPEWTKEDFAKSKRGLFYRPKSILVKSEI